LRHRARKLLTEFNVNLDTADLKVARSITRSVLPSSGSLPFVKAMGAPWRGTA
jgi:glutamate formiminotransferase